jgi:putative ABC transport system permease protein
LLTALLGPFAQSRFGLVIEPKWVSAEEFMLLATVVGVGLCASLVPGYRAYKLSLADGLTPRL